MPELYNEQEELIYFGRGKYSRRAKACRATHERELADGWKL